METKKLKELKKMLEDFIESDIFGLGEIEYIQKVNETIEIVDSAIINNEEE